MTDNVVRLPRPVGVRPRQTGLAFYVRVGRNDHKEMLDLIATGEQGIWGFVIGAHNIDRHRELLIEARRRGFHVVMDPMTPPMAFPGGHRDSLATLPWGLSRYHNVTDFDAEAGRTRAAQVVATAIDNGFTQLLGPTHLLNGPNDAWLRRDITVMQWTAHEIGQRGGQLDLIYPLIVPMDMLRRRAERLALAHAIEDAPCNAIWLTIENFGDAATGEKTAAYIEAARDFHSRGLPVVGDYLGGLPALGALAFGAVGGIAHGVTVNQNFKAQHWRRPPTPSGGGASWRVYVPQLDVLLKPPVAQALLANPRIRARCGCRDTHCCPHGVRDMFDRPARHAIYQRAREMETLSAVPESVRATQYIEDRVRRVSDNVASVASAASISIDLRDRFVRRQAELSRFRQAMAHLADAAPSESVALAPSRRAPPGVGGV